MSLLKQNVLFWRYRIYYPLAALILTDRSIKMGKRDLTHDILE